MSGPTIIESNVRAKIEATAAPMLRPTLTHNQKKAILCTLLAVAVLAVLVPTICNVMPNVNGLNKWVIPGSIAGALGVALVASLVFYKRPSDPIQRMKQFLIENDRKIVEDLYRQRRLAPTFPNGEKDYTHFHGHGGVNTDVVIEVSKVAICSFGYLNTHLHPVTQVLCALDDNEFKAVIDEWYEYSVEQSRCSSLLACGGRWTSEKISIFVANNWPAPKPAIKS